jgi:hypothetical protein
MKVRGDVMSSVRRHRWPLAVALLVVPLVGTAVEAAIPDSGGDIHACLKVYTGRIRIIDTAVTTTCDAAERPLKWSSKTLLTGNAPPVDADGADGDLFIDLTNKVIYGPKAMGSWPAGVKLEGEKGDPGTNGVSGRELITGPDVTVAANATADTTVACTAGKKIIGGGVGVPGPGFDADIVVLASYPTLADTWAVAVKNTSGGAKAIFARAVCATAD